ncbi:MAG: dTDP-4-dehydrorhamnose reductase [Bacteroidales bacterium]|nr:dTDP-4-dehydrorhamnose reductase [Bacteroidales bacterium]
MNILVTGANGQLGTEIRTVSVGSSHRFIFTDVTSRAGVDTVYLDITNLDAVRLICDSERVDLIVNCAAYTDVEKAETDQALADLLNHQAPANLARVAAERDAVLIHISTDYVFHGDIALPCREDWPVDPTGVYGITKLQGERAVLESGCRSLIFRTAWLYSPYGKNFLKTMLRLTAERDSLKVVFDQVGTPTYAADLAALIRHIVETEQLDKTGIYHFSNEGVCSWYDFACAIRDLGGHTCEIRPCHSDEFPSKVRRPAFSVLDKTLVKQTFGFTVPHWYDSLKKCIAILSTGEIFSL